MNQKYFEIARELCRALIRCPSVSGQEKEAAATLKNAMEQLGFDSVCLDRYGNILGIITGTRPGPCVLLDGHIDTVPVPMKPYGQYRPLPQLSRMAGYTAGALPI